MRWIWSGIAALLVLAACVTINVYFPAAAAEKAADKFINGVIGDTGNAGESTGGWTFNLLPIATAHAQADLDIEAPAVRQVQERMSARFSSTLKAHFESGAIGLTADGLVAMRDAKAVSLAQRSKLAAAIAEENKDRATVYREIAIANGHQEWESDIRQTFARRWIERAPSGWYYQDSAGDWQRKS